MTPEILIERVVALLPSALQPLARRFDPAFLRFAAVGAIGFTVDLIVLTLLVRFAGWTPATLPGTTVIVSVAMQARLVSFPVAVISTWALNRSWTFKRDASHPILKELISYVSVQGAGGVANVGTYALALFLLPALKAWLIVPLAMGSAVGLCLTFVGSKYWAFRHRH